MRDRPKMTKDNSSGIRILNDTRKRLEKYGEFGDTHDDVINKIIDNLEGRKIMASTD